MPTVTWKITNMLRNANDGAVTRVGWEAVASDAGVEAPMRGAVNLVRGDAFTPFEQLTEEQVMAWVKTAPETATVEATLTKRVEELASHIASTASGLPWAVPVPEEAA